MRFRRASIGLIGSVGVLITFPACTLLFPTEPGDELTHFADQAPQIDDQAPLFTLRDLADNDIALDELVVEQPLVIQLGSHTCPVYRYRRFAMESLRQEFDGRVTFVVVYTLEAHPTGSPSPYSDDEWRPWINRLVGVDLAQPITSQQRMAQARWSTKTLAIGSTVVVDNMANSTWNDYGAAPSAAFVIARSGSVYLRQAWVDPDEIRDALIELLPEAK